MSSFSISIYRYIHTIFSFRRLRSCEVGRWVRWISTGKYSTVQYSTVQYSAVQPPNTVLVQGAEEVPAAPDHLGRRAEDALLQGEDEESAAGVVSTR